MSQGGQAPVADDPAIMSVGVIQDLAWMADSVRQGLAPQANQAQRGPNPVKGAPHHRDEHGASSCKKSDLFLMSLFSKSGEKGSEGQWKDNLNQIKSYDLPETDILTLMCSRIEGKASAHHLSTAQESFGLLDCGQSA